MSGGRHDTRAHRRANASGVLVLVAIALPVLVLFASLVVDVGNWFEHKRHLQMQADAAALAAAREFRLHRVSTRRSSTRPGEATPANLQRPDRRDRRRRHPHAGELSDLLRPGAHRDDTVVTGAPCSAKMVDVKMTETDLPWISRAAQVPFINAHARVSILQADTLAGSLPIGVPGRQPAGCPRHFRQ